MRRDDSQRTTKAARVRSTLALGIVVLGASLVAGTAEAAARRLLVQRRFAQEVPATSVSATFKRANTAGNLIVAYVVWDNGDPVTISDSNGNTYTSAIGPTQPPAAMTAHRSSTRPASPAARTP